MSDVGQDARWVEAARARMLELRRHPGHDGLTVCACTECALWTLLTLALDALAGVGEARPLDDKHESCARPRGCATPFTCDRGDAGSACIYKALQEHERRAGEARPAASYAEAASTSDNSVGADARARAERTLASFAGVKAPWNEAQLARDVVALTEQLDAAHRETGEYRRMWEETLRERDALLQQGIQAFRLTREYVGERALPEIEGWSWFDWCVAARAALGVVAADADA